jgi:hypothetical protein
MSVALPKLFVESPIQCEGISVFPLFAEGCSGLQYVLSDDALANESVLVTEVDEGGSVPDLLVENKGDERVLFLEGEELVGAKQNRVLNVSVLIGAHTKTAIPVSCVERGRWDYRSRKFARGRSSPSNLRRILKRSVSASLREKRGHRSDQNEVWREVERQQSSLKSSSPTSAMSDTFETHQDRIEEYLERLKPVKNSVGMAVAIADQLVCLDILDSPKTCEQVWERFVSGFILDALEAPSEYQQVSVSEVESLLLSVSGLSWEEAPTVGEGQDYRAENETTAASVLTFEDNLVHASVSLGV